MSLKEAAKVVRGGYAETLAYCEMPREHWRRIRTFPDGKSALMLVAARLKYVADSEWGVPPLPGRVASQRAVVLTAS